MSHEEQTSKGELAPLRTFVDLIARMTPYTGEDGDSGEDAIDVVNRLIEEAGKLVEAPL